MIKNPELMECITARDVLYIGKWVSLCQSKSTGFEKQKNKGPGVN
jgi:hypothetical protein